METQEETEGKRPLSKTILYGILIIVVALVAIVLVARYAFNIDLVNFDEILGTIFVRRR